MTITFTYSDGILGVFANQVVLIPTKEEPESTIAKAVKQKLPVLAISDQAIVNVQDTFSLLMKDTSLRHK